MKMDNKKTEADGEASAVAIAAVAVGITGVSGVIGVGVGGGGSGSGGRVVDVGQVRANAGGGTSRWCTGGHGLVVAGVCPVLVKEGQGRLTRCCVGRGVR